MSIPMSSDVLLRDSGPASSTISRWLREPLLHFLLFGALLFAVDTWLVAARGDERTIVLTTTVDAELEQLFVSERGREPDANELSALRQRWFDNELLYREGLALGLDRGDPGIRERVIFKALNVVQADLQAPAEDDTQLRAWFEQNRGRYDEPPRVDFLEAVIAGQPTLADAAAFAQVLNESGDAQVESGLRVYRGRPLPTIAPAFGEAFAQRLETLPMNTWQALDSQSGPRAIRVVGRSEAKPAEFDVVRDKVRADWRDHRLAELRTQAVRALADKYTLRVVGAES